VASGARREIEVIKMDSKIFLFLAGVATALAIAFGAYFFVLQPPPQIQATPAVSIEPAVLPSVQQQTPTASPLPRERLRTLPFSWETIQAQSCEGIEKPRVYFFEDPYSYITVVSKGESVPVDKFVGFFESKFKDWVDVFHKILPVKSQKMIENHEAKQARYLDNRYAKENVELAQKYFVCAGSQEKLAEFKSCFYDNVLINIFDDGTREFLPMNKSELDFCATQSALDSDNLSRCLITSGMVLSLEFQDAKRLTEMTVPTAVIDCKYRGHSAFVADALCFYYPDTKGC